MTTIAVGTEETLSITIISRTRALLDNGSGVRAVRRVLINGRRFERAGTFVSRKAGRVFGVIETDTCHDLAIAAGSSHPLASVPTPRPHRYPTVVSMGASHRR